MGGAGGGDRLITPRPPIDGILCVFPQIEALGLGKSIRHNYPDNYPDNS
jgi:hypothetical protein